MRGSIFLNAGDLALLCGILVAKLLFFLGLFCWELALPTAGVTDVSTDGVGDNGGVIPSLRLKHSTDSFDIISYTLSAFFLSRVSYIAIIEFTIKVTTFSLSSLNDFDILSSNFWVTFSSTCSVSRWFVWIFSVRADSTFSLLELNSQ